MLLELLADGLIGADGEGQLALGAREAARAQEKGAAEVRISAIVITQIAPS